MRKQKLSLEKLKITKLENNHIIQGGFREISDMQGGGGSAEAVTCPLSENCWAESITICYE